MTTNQIEKCRQKVYVWYRTSHHSANISKSFHENFFKEIAINADFPFSHYKYMEIQSWHSNQSTQATGIKNKTKQKQQQQQQKKKKKKKKKKTHTHTKKKNNVFYRG